jgi:hypothetical protein
VGDVTREYKVGQVYTMFDMGQPDRRLVRMLVRRLEEEEDFSDGWGNQGGKTEHGWYWYCVDLLTGEECITIDNAFDHWERLV